MDKTEEAKIGTIELNTAKNAVDELSKEEISELITYIATVNPEELGVWWAEKSIMLAS